MFVTIFTVVLTNLLRQGFVPDRVTRGVITLLKTHKHGGRDEDYRPITLLNTELRFLAKILTDRLQSVADILLGSQLTCVVKSGTIQSNLYLIRTIIEGIDDDDDTLINLNQFKSFGSPGCCPAGRRIQTLLLKVDQPAVSLPQCWGKGERKAAEYFCAVYVGSLGLFALVPPLRFDVRASQ